MMSCLVAKAIDIVAGFVLAPSKINDDDDAKSPMIDPPRILPCALVFQLFVFSLIARYDFNSRRFNHAIHCIY